MSRSTRFSIYIALLLLPFILLLHLHSHLELERHHHHRTYKFADQPPLIPTNHVSTASLNYETALADILWVGAILYRTERSSIRRSAPGVTVYADAIIELDPYFHPIYRWHNTFRYRALSSPTREDRDEANRILATGLEFFSDDWSMARSLLVNYSNPLLERTDKDHIKDLEEAIYYARLGADMDGAPPEFVGLSINLQERLDRLRATVVDDDIEEPGPLTTEDREFLLRQYFASTDENQQNFLRRQLARYSEENLLLERIDEYTEDYRQLHQTRYPYLTPNLFLLVDSNLYLWHDRFSLGT